VKVPDRVVLDWTRGLPGASEIFIVSLLGKKPGGKSEYSFYSAFDGSGSFQDWLNNNAGRKFVMASYPTIDLEPIERATLEAAAAEVRRLVSKGKTVVIVDSGGWSRTAAVAAALGASLG